MGNDRKANINIPSPHLRVPRTGVQTSRDMEKEWNENIPRDSDRLDSSVLGSDVPGFNDATRRQLLSLLLLYIIAALTVQQVYGSRSSYQFMPSPSDWRSDPIGGVPYVKQHLLMSRCNGRYVQMLLRKKIDARNRPGNIFAVLRFESDPSGDGYVRIQGEVNKMFLCFSKRARLIARSKGDSEQCKFKEELHHGYIKLKSAVHSQWYVGFNSRGRKLRGYKSVSGRRRIRNCFMFTKKDWYGKRSKTRPHRHRHRHRYRGPFQKGDYNKLRKVSINRNNR